MTSSRPILAWWMYLNAAVFLLWFHFAVRDADVIAAALTGIAGQITLALSLLFTVWAIYHAIIAFLTQVKEERRLFYLELRWKHFFALAGIFLAIISLVSIFLSQLTMNPISIISGIVKIAAAFFAGMIGLAGTDVTEKGLLTPFALVSWADVESYDWLDDRHIVFRAITRMSGFRYKMRPTFSIDPNQRELLDSFLAQRIKPRLDRR